MTLRDEDMVTTPTMTAPDGDADGTDGTGGDADGTDGTDKTDGTDGTGGDADGTDSGS